MTSRHSQQKARLLDEGIIAGFERRVSEAGQPKEPLREIYELRAIGRELIGHVNALEQGDPEWRARLAMVRAKHERSGGPDEQELADMGRSS